MEIHCSRCNHHWIQKSDSDHAACPRCGAEAGLEPTKKAAMPMTLFACVLSAALIAIIYSVVLAQGVT